MVNPSIESSDFLFWHKKVLLLELDFWKILSQENRQSKFHILKFRVCVNTHTHTRLNLNSCKKCTLSVSHKLFKNPTPNFFLCQRVENQSFRLMAHLDHICATLCLGGGVNIRCEKAAKLFCKTMSQKSVPWAPFWISPLYFFLLFKIWFFIIFFLNLVNFDDIYGQYRKGMNKVPFLFFYGEKTYCVCTCLSLAKKMQELENESRFLEPNVTMITQVEILFYNDD